MTHQRGREKGGWEGGREGMRERDRERENMGRVSGAGQGAEAHSSQSKWVRVILKDKQWVRKQQFPKKDK